MTLPNTRRRRSSALLGGFGMPNLRWLICTNNSRSTRSMTRRVPVGIGNPSVAIAERNAVSVGSSRPSEWFAVARSRKRCARLNA